jgi:cytochrome c553
VRVRGEALALRGDAARDVPACANCHGTMLTGVNPDIPGLLGLSRDYIRAQLGAWRNGNLRSLPPDCMAEIARRLAPDDVEAVAAWLAAQPVPAGARPAAAPPRPLPMTCGSVARVPG